MFKDIYLFEIKSWLSKPAFYIYSLIILIISTLLFASSAGVFDSNTATVSSLKYLNSPKGVLEFVMGMSVMLFLLFPNIVGESIAKDYKYNIHKVMYSYAFTKPTYFFGKYLSAMTICLFLTLMIPLGMMIAMSLPGVNEALVGPHSYTPYLIAYAVYVIPGVFLFGSIIFSIVTFSRSVVAGFVAMIALYIFQTVFESSFSNMNYEELGTLLDPFGSAANTYYTKYWTITEENFSPIPLKGYVIWNRLLWCIIGIGIFIWSYTKFQFHTEVSSFNWFKKKPTELISASHKTQQIQQVVLPQIERSYGWKQKLQSAWALSKIDLKYTLTGGTFIVITILGLLMLVIMVAFGDTFMQTKTLPTTAKMLTIPGTIFRLFIDLLTFIYVGMLINRNKKDNIFQLEDVTPTYDFSFIFSKFLSITIMQGFLLFLPIIAGVIYQISQGYYHFEFDVYFYDLYVVRWLNFVPWTLLAMFIYTLIPNFYIGLTISLILSIGMSFLGRIGVEQDIFKYNSGGRAMYSDIAGFGYSLKEYLVYRFYWILAGVSLVGISSWIWRRGMPIGIVDRIKNIKSNVSNSSASLLGIALISFLALGSYIYYETNITTPFYSSKEQEEMQADYEKMYSYLASVDQPRITAINAEVELYPTEGNFEARASYWLKNKSMMSIDSIIIDHAPFLSDLSFSKENTLIHQDSLYNIRIYTLAESLSPQDSIMMSFTMKNRANTIFSQDVDIKENGTFINNSIFPNIGYQPAGELTDNKTRKKHGLNEKERMADQNDAEAHKNTYISNCADWIDFEIKIGTESDQLAMAPGRLIAETEANGRKQYQYRMNEKMLNFFNICSARYEKMSDKWNDVDLSIYYHKGHEYNLDRMMQGLKDGLDYYTTEFSPYQHDQVRILEFPGMSFAQSFAGTIPFSENIGFVAQVDDSEDGGVDFPYAVTAHELAHQWWAHQVIGAEVKGATMLSESLSEYSSLKVLEKRYGSDKMRLFLKDALDKYLLFRSMEQSKELPLAQNENQQYIHYQKGSLVFYALSDLIGDKNLNKVLSNYIDSVAFQEAPYTDATELVSMLRQATPDSMQYFIDDNFDNITLYNNRIQDASVVMNTDSTYTVDITAHVTKYRTDEKGKQIFHNDAGDTLKLMDDSKRNPTLSYPLNDFVDVAIFGEETIDNKTKEKVLYLQKHRISQIENKFSITVDQLPKEVGIDPYNKLIDRDSEDNRRKVKL